MIFIDTNYFLRFLLEDVAEQHGAATALFRRGAEGKARLCTSVVVYFEVYWVLSSFYGKSKEESARMLARVLLMEFIRLEGREALEEALQSCVTRGISLEDAYNLAYARSIGADEFMTFDQKLSKIASMRLREAQGA